MFSGRKRLKVDLAEFDDRTELLTGFLQKHIKGKVTSGDHNVLVESEELSSEELKEIVKKFIYHQHLNNTCFAALEGPVVTIHRFKEKKIQKRKKPVANPATIKHGWL